MIKKVRLMLLFLIGAVLLVGCSDSNELPGYAQVSGRVVYLGDHGKIIDEDWGGSAQTVYVRGTELVTESKMGGGFVFENVPLGKHTLEIIYHGYEVETVQFNLKSNKALDIGNIEIHRDYDGPVQGMSFLYLNNSKVEPALREAISLAIDKEEILRIRESFTELPNLSFKVLNQLVPFVAAGYDDSLVHDFNYQKARQIVDECGLKGQTVVLTHSIDVEESSVNVAISNYIAQQLRGLGLNVQVISVVFETFISKISETYDYELALVHLTVSNQKSPLPSIYGKICSGSSTKVYGIETDLQQQIDNLFQQSKLKYDREEFNDTISQIQSLALKNHVIIPLLQRVKLEQ